MGARQKAHRQGWEGNPDPMEAIIEKWLIERGVSFTRDHPSHLDFYLPGLQLFIECKRFYTPRVNDQLERVRGNNVIVVQGIDAWATLQLLLGDGGSACPNRPRPRSWIDAYERPLPAKHSAGVSLLGDKASPATDDQNPTLRERGE